MRIAKRPLNPDAVKKANEAVGRRLSMSPADASDRKKWMDAYLKAGGEVEPPAQQEPVGAPAKTCAPPPPADRTFGYKPAKGDTFSQDYGYWCGSDNAPLLFYPDGTPRAPAEGAPPGLEGSVEEDPAKWTDEYLNSLGVPAPMDSLDRGCMVHDLRLAVARKKRKARRDQLGAASGDLEIAKINQEALIHFTLHATEKCPALSACQMYAAKASVAFAAQVGWNLTQVGAEKAYAAGAAVVSAAKSITTEAAETVSQGAKDAWNYVFGD